MGKLSSGILIMVDIETLAKSPLSVVTQAAFMAVPLDDPDTRLKFDDFYLPVTPQIEAGRAVDGDTLIWWMQQNDAARAKFQENSGGDSDTLIALVRSMIRKIAQVMETTDGPVEIWAKGPQFDVVILESLFAMCGERAPWRYDQVRDLRTYMKIAGVSTDDVDSHDIVKHVALEDCRFQIRCYQECARRMMARV